MKTTATITTLVVLMFLMGPAAALDLEMKDSEIATSEEGSYIGLGTGDLGVDCSTEDALGACLGGYGFSDLAGGDITITITDDLNNPVSAAYDAGGGEVAFCGSVDIDGFDGGDLTVFVDGPVFASSGACPTGLATTGKIAVT